MNVGGISYPLVWLLIGIPILVAGCTGPLPPASPDAPIRGFTANVTTTEGDEYTFTLDGPVSFLAADGTHQGAYRLRIQRVGEESGSVTHLDKDLRVLRTHSECQDHQCVYSQAWYNVEGTAPAAGLAWPALAKDGIFVRGAGMYLRPIPVDVETTETSIRLRTGPEPFNQNNRWWMPGNATLEYAHGEILPLRIQWKDEHLVTQTWTRTSFETGDPLPPITTTAVPFSERPRLVAPNADPLFPGADHDPLAYGVTHKEAWDALRTLDRTPADLVANGGCIAYLAVLPNQSRGLLPIAGYDPQDTWAFARVADRDGVTRFWSWYRTDSLLGSQWTLREAGTPSEEFDCTTHRALDAPIMTFDEAVDLVPQWTGQYHVPLHAAYHRYVNIPDPNVGTYNEDRYSFRYQPLITGSPTPTFQYLYTVSIRADLGIFDWLFMHPDDIRAADQAE